MPKRIVICSDGTGNSAIKGRGTNVFKLFEAVDLETHKFDPDATPQIAIYDDGVGTEKFKPLKILSGATGWGLSRNVKHLYKELARIYDPGDDIYMFGFSRGAFTVRTLVGLHSDLRAGRSRTASAQDVRVAAAGREQRLQGLPAVLSAQAVADAVRGEDRRERGIQTGALAALRHPDPVPRRLGHGRRGGLPVPAERRDQRDAVSVQVLRSQAQPPRAASLSGARHRRDAGIVRAAALGGRSSRPRANPAGLVRRRPLERRRRLSEAGHVAGGSRLAAQSSGAAPRSIVSTRRRAGEAERPADLRERTAIVS